MLPQHRRGRDPAPLGGSHGPGSRTHTCNIFASQHLNVLPHMYRSARNQLAWHGPHTNDMLQARSHTHTYTHTHTHTHAHTHTHTHMQHIRKSTHWASRYDSCDSRLASMVTTPESERHGRRTCFTESLSTALSHKTQQHGEHKVCESRCLTSATRDEQHDACVIHESTSTSGMNGC